MNWNRTLRQTHRWVSIAFTVAVIVNIVALARQQSAAWIGFLALLPLVLLLLTGLYLFAQPHVARWRTRPVSGRAPGGVTSQTVEGR